VQVEYGDPTIIDKQVALFGASETAIPRVSANGWHGMQSCGVHSEIEEMKQFI